MPVAISPVRDTCMLYLPRTMEAWQWKRTINPQYKTVSKQSRDLFYAFKSFTRSSEVAFDKCDFGRLASLAYPTQSKEHLRTGCDLMTLLFLVDEYTAVHSQSAVKQMADVIIDALNNPHHRRPEGEILLGQVVKEFWIRAVKHSTPEAQKFFLLASTDHLNSLVSQAHGAENQTFNSVPEYIAARRVSTGARVSYFPGAMNLTLPDDVWYHPLVRDLENHIADLIMLDSDLASFNTDQASGDDGRNIVSIVMRHHRTNYLGAIEWISTYHAEIEAKFIQGIQNLPHFGLEIDEQLSQYIEHLANWPRCNDCWNFESGKYFGSKGLQIMKSRYVPFIRRC